jgi:multiple antibiotic resistance protein
LAAHESERKNFLLGGAGTIVGIFLVALSVFIFYRYAKKVTKSFGQSGSEVIMRLAAFINLCLGLQIMWFGLKALIHQL